MFNLFLYSNEFSFFLPNKENSQIDYAREALLSTKRGRNDESGYLYPSIAAMYGNVNYIKNLQNYYM